MDNSYGRIFILKKYLKDKMKVLFFEAVQLSYTTFHIYLVAFDPRRSLNMYLFSVSAWHARGVWGARGKRPHTKSHFNFANFPYLTAGAAAKVQNLDKTHSYESSGARPSISHLALFGEPYLYKTRPS